MASGADILCRIINKYNKVKKILYLKLVYYKISIRLMRFYFFY